METPKEKALQLVNKFSAVGLQMRDEGITCALIAVDEIQEHAQMIEGTYEGYESVYLYFIKVKLEIEKL